MKTERPLANLLRDYQQDVQRRHPAHVETWPLLNGWDFLQGTYKDWTIVVVQDAGFSSMCKQTGIGELSQSTVGVATITEENREAVRRRLEKHFNIGKRDAIILFDPNDSCAPEFSGHVAAPRDSFGTWQHENLSEPQRSGQRDGPPVRRAIERTRFRYMAG
jgi:hypothetical protein